VLPDATYMLAAVPPSGSQQTEPAQNMTQTVQVAGGEMVFGIPFGIFQDTTISGTVFNDLNGDGSLEAGEPGIPGASLTLWDANGAPFETVRPDSNGAYSYSNVGPGSFPVQETTPTGSNATSPTAIVVNPNLSGTNVTDLDFGNFILVSISGEVFNDLNGD